MKKCSHREMWKRSWFWYSYMPIYVENHFVVFRLEREKLCKYFLLICFALNFYATIFTMKFALLMNNAKNEKWLNVWAQKCLEISFCTFNILTSLTDSTEFAFNKKDKRKRKCRKCQWRMRIDWTSVSSDDWMDRGWI